jgi:hypothetical protein
MTTKGGPPMSGTRLPPAGESATAEVYQGSQRPRRARTAAIDRPRPLEFDRNGFPVAQRSPDFVARVDRLLSPLGRAGARRRLGPRMPRFGAVREWE